ncbi:MAG: LamG-like jellyroll fold domain-containing protein [Candidatus Woesearchaeota archaeon]
MKRKLFFGLLYLLLIVLPCLSISYVEPTPHPGAFLSKDYLIVNLSIQDLENIVWQWDGTNFSYRDSDLVAHYNFDDDPLKDRSEYGEDLSETSNLPSHTDGRYGGAYHYEEEYLEMPDADNLEIQDKITISAWIKLDDDIFSYAYILQKPYEDPNYGFYIDGIGGRNNLKLSLELDGPGNSPTRRYQEDTGGNIVKDEWQHIAVTFDKDGNISFFINGNMTSTSNETNNFNTKSGIGYIGKGLDPDEFEEYFPGYIDEIRIWNRTLSPQEIMQQYQGNLAYDGDTWNLFINQSELSEGLHWYKTVTDEEETENHTFIVDMTDPLITLPANMTTTDKSILLDVNITEKNIQNLIWEWDNFKTTFYLDDLSLFNDMPIKLDGYEDGTTIKNSLSQDLVLAMNFNNNSGFGEDDTFVRDFSKFGNDGTIDNATFSPGRYGSALEFNESFVEIPHDPSLNLQDEWTISVWIKPHDLDGYQAILSKGTNPRAVSLWAVDSNIRIWYNNSDDEIESEALLNEDTWHHIVARYNGTFTLYFDGEINISQEKDSPLTNTNKLYVGNSNALSAGFSGLIDALRIWNRSLSHEEIRKLHAMDLEEEWQIQVNQTKNATHDLLPGRYQYSIETQDRAGNKESQDAQVLIDSGPPNIIDQTQNQYSRHPKINLLIQEENLADFIYSWNDSNITLYQDDLALFYNGPESIDTIYLKNYSQENPAKFDLSDSGISEGLLLAMNFNNNSAFRENYTFIADVSGNDNDGTWLGDSTSDNSGPVTQGKFNGGYKFDGKDDCICLDNDGICDNTDSNPTFDDAFSNRSVSLWFRANEIEDTQILYEEGGPVNGMNIYIRDGKIFIGSWSESTVWAEGLYLSKEINKDVFYHVVLDFNYEGNLSLYLNGKKIDSQPIPDYLDNHPNADSIGCKKENTQLDDGDSSGDGLFFNGTIDVFRIWNRSLSEEEIQTFYMSNLRKSDADWNFSSNITGLTSGEYSYGGYSTDLTGATDQATGTIIIDVDPPLISYDIAPNETIYTPHLTMNLSMTERNLEELTLDWNGSNVSVFDDSLVLMYNFEKIAALEENDTYIADLSGNDNPGTGINFDGDELNNDVISLEGASSDGTCEHVELSPALGLSENFSYELWIYANQSDGNLIEERVYKYDTALYLEEEKVVFGWWNSPEEIIETTPIRLKRWTHVIANYHDSVAQIYIDGRLRANSSLSGQPGHDGLWTALGKADNEGDWEGGLKSCFEGKMDNVRIRNKSLSKEEVAVLYNTDVRRYDHETWGVRQNKAPGYGNFTYQAFARDKAGNQNETNLYSLQIDSITPTVTFDNQTPENDSWVNHPVNITASITTENPKNITWNQMTMYDSSVVAMYDFDMVEELGESATEVIDMSCNDNTGFLESDPEYTTGRYGGAFNLSADYMAVPNIPSLNTNAITMIAWVYPEFIDENMGVINKDGSYQLWVNGNGSVSFKVFTNNSETILTTGNITPGGWHFLVGIYDGKNLTAYIDGKKAGTTQASGTIKTSQGDLFIGKINQNQYFYGRIDEVDIYERALSGKEIRTHYISNLERTARERWEFLIEKNWTDGTHTYQLSVSDTLDKRNQSERTLHIDTTPPELQIENYTNDDITAMEHILEAYDLTSLRWSTNSSYFNITKINETSANLTNTTPLIPGEGYLTIEVKDLFNHSTTGEVFVTINASDTEPPIINLTDVPENESSKEITFEYNVSDENEFTCHLYINGTHYNTTYQKENSYTTTISDGNYNWSINCTDQLGNQKIVNETFTVDSVSPLVEIDSPEKEETMDIALIECTGSDIHYKNISLWGNWTGWHLNETIATEGKVSFTPDLSDGNYTFQCQAYDTFGHSNKTANRSFIIDTQGPQINAGSYSSLENETLYQEISAEDSSGIKRWSTDSEIFEIVPNDEPIVNLTNKTILSPGNYTITINVNDSLDNPSSEEITITINDTTSPIITLNTSTNKSTSRFGLQYQVSDYSEIINCSLYINDTYNLTNHSVGTGNNTFSVILEDGFYNWSVRCTDAFKNIGHSQVKDFLVDSSPPQVSINSPPHGTHDSSITINCSAYDRHLSNVSLWGNWSGLVNTSDAQGESHDAIFNISQDDGNYSYRCTADDTFSNSNETEVRNFFMDTRGPVFSNGLTQYDAMDNSDFSQTITADDPSGIDDWWLNDSSVFNITGSGSQVQLENITPLVGKDNQTITLFVNDSLNHNSSLVINITIISTDDKNPKVSLIAPYDNITDSQVVFTYNVTDNVQIKSCDLYIDDILNRTNNSVSQGTNSFSVQLDDDSYNWSINCTDTGSNHNHTDAYSFLLDSTHPQIEGFSKEFSNTWIAINCSAHDNNLSNISLWGNWSGWQRINKSDAQGDSHDAIFNLSLDDGNYSYRCTAHDTFGNKNQTGNISFFIDKKTPRFISSPDRYYQYNNRTVDFQVTVDDLSGIESWNISNTNLKSYSNSTHYINLTNASELDGGYDLRIDAIDKAGNKNSTDMIINITAPDMKPPNITLMYPQMNNFTQYQENYTFKASDDIGIRECKLFVDNELKNLIPSSTGENNIEYKTSEGHHQWFINCSDVYGKTNLSSSWNFTVDRTPPDTFAVSPKGSVDTLRVDITCEAEDQLTNITEMTLSLNWTDTQISKDVMEQSSKKIFSNIDLPQDGIYEYTCGASDQLGNVQNASPQVFSADTRPPESLFSNDFYQMVNISFNETLSFYDMTGVDTVWENHSDFTIHAHDDKWYILNATWVDLQDINLTLFFNDTLGNEASKEITIHITENDTEKPSIKERWPEQDKNISGKNLSGRVLYLFYIPDDNVAVTTCSLYINGTLNQTKEATKDVENNFSIKTKDTSYNWTINCSDPYDNTNRTTDQEFQVDGTPPSIKTDLQEKNTSQNITVNCSASDRKGLKNISLFGNWSGWHLNKSESVAGQAEFALFDINVSEGKYLYQCQAADTFRNINKTINYTLIFDLSPPLFQDLQSTYYTNQDLFQITIGAYDKLTRVEAWYAEGANLTSINKTHVNLTKNLSEITSEISISVNDSLNNSNEMNITIIKDDTPPKINVTYPAASYNTNSEQLDIEYNISEDIGIKSCNLTIKKENEADVLLNASLNVAKISLPFGDGNYTWHVNCSDKAGNWNKTDTYTINLDTIAPNVSTLYPNDMQYFNASTINFSCYAKDSGTVSNISLWGNWGGEHLNDTIYLPETEKNTFQKIIPEGMYWYRCHASDAFGNTNQTGNTHFTVINKPPSVTLDYPEDFITSVPDDFIYYTTNYIDNCSLYIDGNHIKTRNHIFNGKNYFTSISLPEGEHKWNVTCIDKAGNKNTSETSDFIVDTGNPDISGDAQGSTINCSAQDGVSGIKYISLFGNWSFQSNTTEVSGYANWSLFEIDYPDGYYVWKCQATDKAGNTNSTEEKEILIDSQNPQITLDSPINASFLSRQNISFHYSVQDTSKENNCSLYIDSIVNQTKTINKSGYFLSDLKDGRYEWHINCSDLKGNTGESVVYKLGVDTIEPQIEKILISDTSSSRITIEVEATDNIEIENISLLINETNKTYTKYTNQTFEIELIDGNYTAIISVCDLARNCKNETEFFEVDTPAPTIQIPAKINHELGPDLEHVFNITDDGTIQNATVNHSSFDIRKDSDTYALVSTKDLETKVYTLQITASDGKNENSTNTLINVTDLTEPSIFVTVDSSTNDVRISYMIEDSSDIDNCTTYIDSIMVNYSSQNSITQNYKLENGDYILNVSCIDQPGNQRVESQEFNVDYNPITIISPPDTTFEKEVQFTFDLADQMDNCTIVVDGTKKKTFVNPTGTNNLEDTLSYGFHEWSVICFNDNFQYTEVSTVSVIERNEDEDESDDRETDESDSDPPPSACIPQWECDEWSKCTNGSRSRGCTDLNSCDEDKIETETCKDTTEDTDQQPDKSENATQHQEAVSKGVYIQRKRFGDLLWKRTINVTPELTHVIESIRNVGLFPIENISLTVKIPFNITDANGNETNTLEKSIDSLPSWKESRIEYHSKTYVKKSIFDNTSVKITFRNRSDEERRAKAQKVQEEINRTKEALEYNLSYEVDRENNQTTFNINLSVLDNVTNLENVSISLDIPKCLITILEEENILEGIDYEVTDPDPVITWHLEEITSKEQLSLRIDQISSDDCLDRASVIAIAKDIVFYEYEVDQTKVIIGGLLSIVLFIISAVSYSYTSRIGEKKDKIFQLIRKAIPLYKKGFKKNQLVEIFKKKGFSQKDIKIGLKVKNWLHYCIVYSSTIISNFTAQILIVLCFLDIFNLFGADIDFAKKIISWALLFMVFYNISITGVLFGFERTHGVNINLMILLGYLLLLSKDLFAFSRAVLTKEGYISDLLVTIARSGASEIWFFYAGIGILLISAIYISKRDFYKFSLAGAIGQHQRSSVSKFIISFILLVLFYILVFDKAMEWLAIAIDSYLVVIIFMTIIIILYKKGDFVYFTSFKRWQSFVNKIFSHIDQFYALLFSLFHYMRTLPLGIMGLLIINMTVGLCVYIFPYINAQSNPLYTASLGNKGHLPLFFSDSLISSNIGSISSIHFPALVIAYLINIIFLSTLIIILLYFWYWTVNNRHNPNLQFKDFLNKNVMNLIFISTASSVVFLLKPVFSFETLYQERLFGVDILTQELTINGLYITLLMAIGLFFILRHYTIIHNHLAKIYMTGVLLAFVYYLTLFFTGLVQYLMNYDVELIQYILVLSEGIILYPIGGTLTVLYILMIVFDLKPLRRLFSGSMPKEIEPVSEVIIKNLAQGHELFFVIENLLDQGYSKETLQRGLQRAKMDPRFEKVISNIDHTRHDLPKGLLTWLEKKLKKRNVVELMKLLIEKGYTEDDIIVALKKIPRRTIAAEEYLRVLDLPSINIDEVLFQIALYHHKKGSSLETVRKSLKEVNFDQYELEKVILLLQSMRQNKKEDIGFIFSYYLDSINHKEDKIFDEKEETIESPSLPNLLELSKQYLNYSKPKKKTVLLGKLQNLLSLFKKNKTEDKITDEKAARSPSLPNLLELSKQYLNYSKPKKKTVLLGKLQNLLSLFKKNKTEDKITDEKAARSPSLPNLLELSKQYLNYSKPKKKTALGKIQKMLKSLFKKKKSEDI